MGAETKLSKEAQTVNPTSALTPFEEMDRMFDTFFRRSWPRFLQSDWFPTTESMLPFNGRLPKVDVIDREAEIEITAEIPGVDKKDLDISVGSDSLTLKGSTRREEKEEKGDYYRRELSVGSFSRTIPLPTQVDASKTKANIKDGLLRIVLPKVEKSQRHSVKVE